jgi:hypothetical protein
MIEFLLTAGDVYHVTLDPSLDEIRRRITARGSVIADQALSDHVEWMRARQRPWTCRVDNTQLSPEETLAEIAKRIRAGEGRITGPLPT